MRIGIDAGHGGLKNGVYQTSGKRSLHPVDGEVFYEGVNNRLYAKEWGDILEKFGHEVVYIVDPNDPTDVPLSTRVTIANSKDLDLLVSIHSNAAANPTARGHEVFTCIGETKSDEYAKAWGMEFKHTFPKIKYRHGQKGALDKEALFTMVTKTTCSAILIELEFHTNDEAVRLMRNWEFRFKTGLCLARSIHMVK
jgi:N-acetylmuramoyl-L-alanine amidase